MFKNLTFYGSVAFVLRNSKF